MAIAFLIISAIVLIGLFWLSSIDGAYKVKKTTLINASLNKAFDTVNDFNTWTIWSPWFCIEPTANVNIAKDGKKVGSVYAWAGKMVGSGELEHIGITPNHFIEQQIRFKKPFKSKSKVFWEFSEEDNQTKVAWGMEGKLPFLLKFMAPKITPWIGMDYERGLKMLKDYIETGSVASAIDIEGVCKIDEIHFLAKKVNCQMKDIGDSMKATFKEIEVLSKEKSIEHEVALSIYHNFDITDTDCTYSSGIPIKKEFPLPSSDYYFGKIHSTKAVKIVFKGDYEHLGNAWATGFSYLRYKKLRQRKTVDLFEIYLTNPQKEADKTKWITEVYIPVR